MVGGIIAGSCARGIPWRDREWGSQVCLTIMNTLRETWSRKSYFSLFRGLHPPTATSPPLTWLHSLTIPPFSIAILTASPVTQDPVDVTW